MTSGTAVQILNNKTAKIQIRGRKITVGGVDAWHDPQGAKYFIGEMEEEPGVEDIRILVSHIPDAIHYLKPQSRIDLVVSGHTHGGQVRIPFYGSLLKSTNLGPRIAAGGLHTLNGNALYISRGVGTEAGQAPRIRFLCPPEISRLELRR
jgi:predicted MPP superfamily phosphohydrolase